VKTGALAGLTNIGYPDECSVLDIASNPLTATGSSSGIAFTGRPIDDPACAGRTAPAFAAARLEPTGLWANGLVRTTTWFRASAITN